MRRPDLPVGGSSSSSARRHAAPGPGPRRRRRSRSAARYPGATAVATFRVRSRWSTSGASVLHSTVRPGSGVPRSPRTSATSANPSPVTSSAGGGRMTMLRAGPATAERPATAEAPWGTGLAGSRRRWSVSSSTAARRLSSASSGSSSSSGVAPSAALASAMLGNRSAGILGQHAEDRGLEIGRAVGHALADRRRRLLDLRLHDGQGGAGERRRHR